MGSLWLVLRMGCRRRQGTCFSKPFFFCELRHAERWNSAFRLINTGFFPFETERLTQIKLDA